MKTIKYYIEHFDQNGTFHRTKCDEADGRRRAALYQSNLDESRKKPNSPEFMKHQGVRLVRETIELDVLC